MLPRNPARMFRTVAVAEAVSWVGLLTGMYFKYLTDAGELGVRIFGPIHGGIFIAYVAMTLVTSRRIGWGWRITMLGLACSVPPFATWIFEAWAHRSGRLSPPASLPPQEPLHSRVVSGDRA